MLPKTGEEVRENSAENGRAQYMIVGHKHTSLVEVIPQDQTIRATRQKAEPLAKEEFAGKSISQR